MKECSVNPTSLPPTFLLYCCWLVSFGLSLKTERLPLPWASTSWQHEPFHYPERRGHREDRLHTGSMQNNRRHILGIHFCLVCMCWSESHSTFITPERENKGHIMLAFSSCKQRTLECNKGVWLAMSSIGKIIIPTSSHATLIMEQTFLCGTNSMLEKMDMVLSFRRTWSLTKGADIQEWFKKKKKKICNYKKS